MSKLEIKTDWGGKVNYVLADVSLDELWAALEVPGHLIKRYGKQKALEGTYDRSSFEQGWYRIMPNGTMIYSKDRKQGSFFATTICTW